MIYILVPVFKRIEKTIEFFDSLERYCLEEFKLIITDDSPQFEHKKYFSENEKVDIVNGTGSLYWGGGINYAIEHLNKIYEVSDDDFIVFANNDIVITENMLVELIKNLNINSNAILHPKLVDETGNIISAGSRVLSWFPFLTKHELGMSDYGLARVDLASARFLIFSAETLRLLKGIRTCLPHYCGDNDFTFRAKKLGINTYICPTAICNVDESATGVKMRNISTFNELLGSFFYLKSPNSIKYRYRFVNGHFNPIFSFFVVVSMTSNSILKFIINKLKR